MLRRTGPSSQFIAYAKANPDKINMASGTMEAPEHVAGKLFKMMAGIEMNQVPYRGDTPALTALIGRRGTDFLRRFFSFH